jgi:glycosyltransferase involved in cell wall biosynthesis
MHVVDSKRKVIVMLGIHPASEMKGGISTVIDLYRAEGLFARWPIQYIGTMKSGSHLRKLGVATIAILRFMRLLIARRVGLVHVHSASRASFWRKSAFILLARTAGVPVIFHLHGAEFRTFYEKEAGAFTRWCIRTVLQAVQRVAVLSSQWKVFIESIAPSASVVIIPNPVAVSGAPNEASGRDPATLLFLGRFGQRKGIFDLLQALKTIRTRFPGVRLRCGGDGAVADVLARARELEVHENVEMLGWVSGAAKDRELARATVYVLPSYAEGLPMGVLEAMAAGTPTVATTVGGIPDAIVEGVHGYLVSPGDIDALADRIMRLLGDEELRARIGSAARDRAVDVFSVHKALAQVEALYLELGLEPRQSLSAFSEGQAANSAPGA